MPGESGRRGVGSHAGCGWGLGGSLADRGAGGLATAPSRPEDSLTPREAPWGRVPGPTWPPPSRRPEVRLPPTVRPGSPGRLLRGPLVPPGAPGCGRGFRGVVPRGRAATWSPGVTRPGRPSPSGDRPTSRAELRPGAPGGRGRTAGLPLALARGPRRSPRPHSRPSLALVLKTAEARICRRLACLVFSDLFRAPG